MKRIKVQFPNEKDEQLSGILYMPASRQPHNYAIFAHCFTCSKNLNAVRDIARGLNTQGFGVLTFDFTGLGQSEGTFSETNLSSNTQDLLHAANFLKQNYNSPSLLIGHSFGGAAVLHAAFKLSDISAVATIAAPHDPDHIKHLFDDQLEQIKTDGTAWVEIAGRPFQIQDQFLQDINAIEVDQRLHLLKKPLLVLHSPQDKIVEIENAKLIYESAHHPKSFISLDGADHLLSDPKDAIYAGMVIASWAERYLDSQVDDQIETDHDVVVELNQEDTYTAEIQAGPHRLISDEPQSVGGSELGPTPYEYVAAGLGSCTAMTLFMYARRKNWELESVRVHLIHDKKHIEDSKNEGKIDIFQREIEIIGKLSDEQRERLLQIANKCPVHKTLESSSKIITSLRSLDF
jgi:putative redox protein